MPKKTAFERVGTLDTAKHFSYSDRNTVFRGFTFSVHKAA